ncbi:hypothetical protein [Bacillus subtilis]|uniref:hypothetical protein n=1 Tax=Bacillus subtilis TaxID=1423 RepID=UPI001B92ECAB|nr:hypothetical protein [Bacillus subtilis]CAI6330968.1 hypothetical protein NRS6096_22270 [Bacillus subtilis]
MENKQKLLDALLQFSKSANEISRLWEETGDDTHSNLGEDFPFHEDFCEVVEKIDRWVTTQSDYLKSKPK